MGFNDQEIVALSGTELPPFVWFSYVYLMSTLQHLGKLVQINMQYMHGVRAIYAMLKCTMYCEFTAVVKVQTTKWCQM